MRQTKNINMKYETNTGNMSNNAWGIHKSHLCILRADANGKLRKRNLNMRELQKITGVNTAAETTEKGYDTEGRYNGYAYHMTWCPWTHWGWHCEEIIGNQNTTPWTLPHGLVPMWKTYRQVDNIMLNRTYRNFFAKHMQYMNGVETWNHNDKTQ